MGKLEQEEKKRSLGLKKETGFQSPEKHYKRPTLGVMSSSKLTYKTGLVEEPRDEKTIVVEPNGRTIFDGITQWRLNQDQFG